MTQTLWNRIKPSEQSKDRSEIVKSVINGSSSLLFLFDVLRWKIDMTAGVVCINLAAGN